MQERLGEFQSSAASAFRHIIAACEHLQKVRHHDFAKRVHIAAHIEMQTGLGGAALVHAVDGAGKGDALLHTPIFSDERRERAASFGFVWQHLIGKQPIEHRAITGLRAFFAPALHGTREPRGDAGIRFLDGLRRGAGVERGEDIQRVLRRSARLMRDDARDAQPTAFVVAGIRGLKPRRDAMTRREVGIQ